jgi:hypothetical protein
VDGLFGGGEADQLAERGRLGLRARRLVEEGGVEIVAPLRIERVERQGNRLTIGGNGKDGQALSLATDEIIVTTGFRPDHTFLSEIRLQLDPWLECAGTIGPLIDPNLHSCGTVRPHGARELSHPEDSFFIAGIKSYGRAPTFLAATGYEQVRSIVAWLAGDKEAALRVELSLPETGVCSTTLSETAEACCGGPAPAESDACCVADAEAKKADEAGCGCGPTGAASAAPGRAAHA